MIDHNFMRYINMHLKRLFPDVKVYKVFIEENYMNYLSIMFSYKNKYRKLYINTNWYITASDVTKETPITRTGVWTNPDLQYDFEVIKKWFDEN